MLSLIHFCLFEYTLLFAEQLQGRWYFTKHVATLCKVKFTIKIQVNNSKLIFSW